MLKLIGYAEEYPAILSASFENGVTFSTDSRTYIL